MVGFLRGRRARRERLRARLTAVLLALLTVQLGSLVSPAYACGCGALIPGGQGRITVGREVSVVRWDGEQEQVVMSLTVHGDAERAAWLMPVPHRATVRLGDPGLFDQLATATAPVHRLRRHFWPQDGDWPLTTGGDTGAPPPHGPGPGGWGVGVVGRERLGPFDVARLTADDPAALDDWLRANDFALPAGLTTALRPYAERRWEFVAVRLVPESAGAALRGRLDPLHLTFAADRPVYPMRLSRLAPAPQSLGLYVLAAHRMEPAAPIGGERPRVTFAGRLGATAGPLAELVRGTPFLTAVAQEFPHPSQITGDHELRRSASDTAFRQAVYEDRLMTVAGIPLWLLTIVGALAVANTVAVVLGVRWARARGANPAEAPPTAWQQAAVGSAMPSASTIAVTSKPSPAAQPAKPAKPVPAAPTASAAASTQSAPTAPVAPVACATLASVPPPPSFPPSVPPPVGPPAAPPGPNG